MGLALCLLIPLAAGAEEDFEIAEGEEAEVELPRIPEDAEVLDHLTVGNPTPLRGDFFTDMWGNDTSDIDVRELLHGYNLVIWDGEEGMFAPNPSVVSDLTAVVDEEGNHIYMLTLYDDLYFSDGTPITAWDYAFSMLFSIAPQVQEVGGQPHRKEYILGYGRYMRGTSRGLEGVSVMGDNVLMITLDHEFLPYFFELGLLDCKPYPISEIAPGVVVRDNGNGQGVYLANADGSLGDPVFTGDLLRQTVMNPDTGYLSHPMVVSGPYTLTSWDGETAEFAINPYYKGDENGILPVIETLTYTAVENDSMMDQLAAGQVDLLDKVVRADNVQRGMEMFAAGGYSTANYPRLGLSYISFACERPAMASQAVRQAIAWCVDRDAVTAEYTGNYGMRVDGYYGVGQWMYGVLNGTIVPPLEEPEAGDREAQAAYEAALLAWEEMSLEDLTLYTLDTAAAANLLDQDGWQLNSQGIREKEIDGETVTLDLKLICPVGNNIDEVLQRMMIPNLEAVGIRMTIEKVGMSELLSRWYGMETRDADMLYLASNFDLLFDPSAQFTQNSEGQASWYYTQGDHTELYQLALEMAHTEPGDVLGYMEKWIAFQRMFNEQLPMLPFYSNVYFDFFTENLHDYQISEMVTWGNAIVESALYIAPEEEELPEVEGEAEEDEFPGDDTEDGEEFLEDD